MSLGRTRGRALGNPLAVLGSVKMSEHSVSYCGWGVRISSGVFA